MRVVVVGATGHIGTYLVPRLVRAGHEVVAMSRGEREPYSPDDAWSSVERVRVDRDAEDAAGTFAGRVIDLRPDAVVDLVCFTPASAEQLVEGLRGRVDHHVHCGTVWVHGDSTVAPMDEDDDREPYGDYGVQKDAIEHLLVEETRRGGLVSTVVHPGHISGPGWPCITPAGNLDPRTWQALAAGEPLVLPGSGSELMHHVHADDVAALFERSLERRDAAAGQAFHAVSPQAMTSRGLARAAAAWFGREAVLEQVSWERFAETTAPEHVEASRAHLLRSHSASTRRGREVLGHEPRYSSAETCRQAVRSLVDAGELDLGGARP
ncbi:NAD-dependent epimerase/dehydratase family protein [uncultured Pseudokineococcus sp.]|uniref:NAD-dependent epimerase/dehydratase family protein n=1 Tax=uncultured Pseudokineococcus sp. TaxID=1642928 RepID=UPI00262DCDAE|nr:NAD-dependent epimerase/dehydratase family protein [uncultured Pseudokineococcus sp.]